MGDINLVTLLIVGAFILPLIVGLFTPFSRERIQYAFTSLLDNLEFLGGIILAIYLTRRIFFDNESGVYNRIYEWIPSNIRNLLYGHDVLTYMAAVPVILLLVMIVLRLLTNPLYNYLVIPLSSSLYSAVNSMNGVLRSLLGALCQLPRALYTVLVLGILLSFFNYYFPVQVLGRWMNQSEPYQLVYRRVINPVLNSNLAKRIPVIVNDSFARTFGEVVPGTDGSAAPYDMGQLAKQLTGGNIKVIEYFNGVTLDEAVKSNDEIDRTARNIVGDEKSSKKKAYLIYSWITKNIAYDYNKAEKISTDTRGISSGAIIAFNTRSGICFDYSSLYVAMCRAVGVKVRIVTGLGYSGLSWGDHAWNQVFDAEADRWINVDTTFGVVGDYFDKKDFNVDHKYAEIQGEW